MGDGRYRILKKLGEGGMGEVFLALDNELDRKVALKFLEGAEGSQQVSAAALREAKAAAALDHPYICKVYATGAIAGSRYIAMEFVEGRTLSEVIGQKALDPAAALKAAEEIAEGLEYAHRKSIIHRDLKPSNIILGNTGHIKIMDFGLALRTGPEAPLRAAEQTDDAGTPAYMSPEQARGEKIDGRSDIFSLGVILFEMLTAIHPFEKDTSEETLQAILNQPPPPLALYLPAPPPGLDEIISSLLVKSPRRRMRSAREAQRRIEACRRRMLSGQLQPSSRIPRRRWLLALAAAAPALSTLLVWSWIDLGPRSRLQPGRSILVLPLKNLSGEADQSFLADGMTDALINALTQIEGIDRVISSTTAMRFKDSDLSLTEIGSAVQVDIILEGSLLRSGDRLEVRSRLVEASSERLVWRRTYQGHLGDVLKLQNELARKVADEIQVRLTVDEEKRLSRSAPVDPRARELYWLGLHWAEKRNASGLRKAVDYYQQALDRDSGFAPAWAGLADARGTLSATAVAALPPSVAMPQALTAAQRALAIDPQLAEAHTALANIRYSYEWDWKGAEEAFRQARRLAPNDARTLRWQGQFTAAQGRLDEALEQIGKAKELNPLSPLAWAAMGQCHYFRREFDLAEQRYGTALELDPDCRPAHVGLALVHIVQGRLDLAAQSFRRGLGESRSASRLAERFEKAVALGGDDASEASLEITLSQEDGHYFSPFYPAVYFQALGNRDQALAWLEKAYQARSSYLTSLRVDPLFADLKDDPRFKALEKRIF